MVAKAETEVSNKLDTFKLVVAIGILLAGIGGFYYYADVSLLYRVLGLVGVAIIAVGIALTTNTGHAILSFGREARTEVRKVVWPTRQETVQTTLMVVVAVIILGIFLWLIDMMLLNAVQVLTGRGG
jgi:preprotein translocase subunit SecE